MKNLILESIRHIKEISEKGLPQQSYEQDKKQCNNDE